MRNFFNILAVATEVWMIHYLFEVSPFAAIAAWCVIRAALSIMALADISYYPNRSYYPYWERLPYILGVE